MLNAMMKKKKTRTERIADFKEEASTIVNLRFTTDELVKLNALARARRERTRDVIYPLILHYLNDCAQPEDRPIVIRAVEVVKDQYWGTEEELKNERKLPKFFKGGTNEDRDRMAQQEMGARTRAHLKGIERYYRVSLNDLAASAIEYNFKTLE